MIGLSSWTFPHAIAAGRSGLSVGGAMGVFDLLAFAADNDVAVVQLADNLGISDVGLQEVRTIGRVARDAGIVIELAIRGTDPRTIARTIELAEVLDTRFIRTLTDTTEREPTVEEVIEDLGASVAVLRSAEIVLGIENHDRFKAVTLRRIVEAVDDPQVAICLDTANSVGCLEETAVVVEHLADLTVNIHAKDYRIRRVPSSTGMVVEGTPIGEGRADVLSAIEAIRSRGRDPNIILEAWSPVLDTPESTLRVEVAWAHQGLSILRDRLAPAL